MTGLDSKARVCFNGDMAERTPHKRIAPGVYEITDSRGTFQVTTAYDGSLRPCGWNLIGPDNKWWNTFATKREAIEAITRWLPTP